MKLLSILLLLLCIFESSTFGGSFIDFVPTNPSLDFGTIKVGETKTLEFALITGAFVAEADFQFKTPAPPFTVNPAAGTLKVGGVARQTIKVTVSCTLPGVFSQTMLGKAIRAIGTSQDLAVPLKAEVEADLTLSPISLDLGNVILGESKTGVLSITNPNSVPLSLILSAGPIFSLQPSILTIQPGKSSPVTVGINANVPLGSENGLISFKVGGFVLNKSVPLKANVLAPDLVFVGTPAATKQGGGNNKSVNVNINIKNAGSTASLQCNGTILLDGSAVASFSIDPLNAAAQVNKQASFPTSANGSHVIQVRLDTDNKNQEGQQGEANNVSSSVTVSL